MPITYCPTGDSNANIHYANLSDRCRDNTIYANQEPKTGRGSTGNSLEKRISHGVVINIDGRVKYNSNRLCSGN